MSVLVRIAPPSSTAAWLAAYGKLLREAGKLNAKADQQARKRIAARRTP